MISRIPILALTLLFGLAACSSEKYDADLSQILLGGIKTLRSKPDTAVQRQAVENLSRAQLAGITTPLIRVELEKTGGLATLVLVDEKAGWRTWFTADGASLTFQRGVLVQSRGLGADLMTTDARSTIRALPRRSGTGLARIQRYLDGENHTLALQFTCSLQNIGPATVEILGQRYATQQLRESCTNTTQSFQNDYWIAPGDGVIWQSRQWVGPDLGYISVQVLQ